MGKKSALILANKNGKAYDFAKGVYDTLASRDGDVQYGFVDVDIRNFKDGEIFSEVMESVRGKACYFIHDSTMDPQDWAMSLAEVNDALMRSSAGEINNVLPYMKYARQDRMTSPRTPITSSVIANMIQQYAKRVITTDVHNPAIQGTYGIPFDNLKAFPYIIAHLKNNHADFLENAVLVAPDIGSAKKIESYMKRLELDVAVADKKRDKAGNIERMTMIGDVKGKNAIVVDDMIDSGGTLLTAIDTVKEMGARRIFACATHGLFSNGARERFEDSPLEKVIITDSVPQKAGGKVEIISLSDMFSDAIYRISHGYSISEMFEA